MTRQMLTTKEAAKYLNVAERTLLKWVKMGKIQAYRLSKNNYYKPEDLEKLFKGEIQDNTSLENIRNDIDIANNDTDCIELLEIQVDNLTKAISEIKKCIRSLKDKKMA